MANLSAANTAGNNTINDDRYFFCTIPKCSKLNCDILYKNHNRLPNNLSHDNCNENKFMILNQNIQGTANKIDELLISLSLNAPQIICLTEHHLQTEQIHNVDLGQYALGAAFCRETYKHGGVCIYVSKNLQFNPLKTKHRLLYLKTQFVPRSKHFSSRL